MKLLLNLSLISSLAVLLVGCETFSEQYCQVRVLNATSSSMNSISLQTRIDYHMDPHNRDEETFTEVGDLSQGETSRYFKIKCSKKSDSAFSGGYSLTYYAKLSFLNPDRIDLVVYESKDKVAYSPFITNYLFIDGDQIEITVTDKGSTVKRVN